MKTTEQRINNIIGQLEGVKKMLNDEGKDCLTVIVQFKAAKSAISSLMNKLLEEEMDSCFLKKNKQPEKISKLFKEIIK
ncbi:MAG: metal-sensitive transcriptional regulator [Candidatus Falkowbacteria bacterium]